MNDAKSITLALALTLTGFLLLPTLSVVAETPTTPPVEVQPPAEASKEAPAETIEAPQTDVGDSSDLEMDFLDLPKMQKRIRECEVEEAVAAGCQVDRCVWASNRAWCW